jgi:hypothetical protein
MILVSRYIVPNGYLGIVFFPIIFVKHRELINNVKLINHEKIHLRQQIELLVLPFFVWYFIEFLVRYISCKNWAMAYKNISFEAEAFDKESDLNYLTTRPFWSFIKYI